MAIDSGKIRIEIRKGIPIIDVYHNGELQLADVVWVNHTLLNEIDPPLQLPADCIVNRTGSYSLSADAYLNMQKLTKEFNRIAYVIYSPVQEVIVDFAAKSYLANKKIGKFSSIEDAFEWFQESDQECVRENGADYLSQPQPV